MGRLLCTPECVCIVSVCIYILVTDKSLLREVQHEKYISVWVGCSQARPHLHHPLPPLPPMPAQSQTGTEDFRELGARGAEQWPTWKLDSDSQLHPWRSNAPSCTNQPTDSCCAARWTLLQSKFELLTSSSLGMGHTTVTHICFGLVCLFVCFLPTSALCVHWVCLRACVCMVRLCSCVCVWVIECVYV